MIAAILRAQLISMRRTFGTGAALSILGGIFWYGLWTFGALAAFSVAAGLPAARLESGLSFSLAGICVYWQIIPLISATMGSSLDLRKLLAYPLPHGRLFLVEVLLRLTNGLEVILLLAGGAAGLILNPAGAHIPATVCALAVFVLFNLLLASGMRSLLERLLTKRKIRELLVLIMAAVWVLPRFFLLTGIRSRGADRVLDAALAAGLPWSAAAHAALGRNAVLPWLWLAAWTLAAAWFGRTQFDRSLRYDASAALASTDQSGTRASFADSWYRMPSRILPDPIGAIVEKELRTLARAPAFRNLFFMGFTFGLLIWLPMVIGKPGAGAHRDSFIASHFLTVVALYALTLLGQVTYWNCFAFDRSASAFWFVAPQPISAVLVAKNVASQAPVYLEITILAAISLVLRLLSGWGEVVEAFAVIATCSIYMLAMGNITSVEYPRGLNPERASQGGSGGRFQLLVLIFYPLALLPAGMAFLARYAFNSEIVFRVVLAMAAAAGALIYKLTLHSAADTALKRREAILRALGTGEGPVVS
jgi:ABC-2 type transport system permease protein